MSAQLRPSDSQYCERILVDANGCWMWAGPRSVHGRAILNINGRSKYAYRVVWEELKGPIPDGLQCCHKCDEPACVNPEHIFLGTAKDNMRDCAAKGRIRGGSPKGDANRMTKFADALIAQMRSELAHGARQIDLVRAYGISRSHANRIARGLAR